MQPASAQAHSLSPFTLPSHLPPLASSSPDGQALSHPFTCPGCGNSVSGSIGGPQSSSSAPLLSLNYSSHRRCFRNTGVLKNVCQLKSTIINYFQTIISRKEEHSLIIYSHKPGWFSHHIYFNSFCLTQTTNTHFQKTSLTKDEADLEL